MIFVLVIFVALAMFGVWLQVNLRRSRKRILGHRACLTDDEIIKLFDPMGRYQKSWLIGLLKEVSNQASTKIGFLRPNDLLGNELRAISNYEFDFRFDWVPSQARSKLTDDISLIEAIEIISENRNR